MITEHSITQTCMQPLLNYHLQHGSGSAAAATSNLLFQNYDKFKISSQHAGHLEIIIIWNKSNFNKAIGEL